MGKISTSCFKCGGAGQWFNSTDGGDVLVDPCPICNGTGNIPIYDIDLSEVYAKLKDITDKINDVMNKCNDIFEQLTE